MTLDQACVLAKEILIGEGLPCTIYAQGGKDSIVVVSTLNIDGNEIRNVVELGKGRGLTVIHAAVEIRMI